MCERTIDKCAPSCDDDNLCTTDTCDPATGCIHTKISCNDGVSCTEDSCDPIAGCVQALNASMCTCTATQRPSLELHPKWPIDLSMACSGGAGRLGGKLEFAADGTLALPGCHNACVGSGSLGASATVTLGLCTGKTITLSESASYSQTRSSEPTCSATTCESGCSAGYCATDVMSGSVQGSVSQFYGKTFEETAPGGATLKAKCGGTIGGSLGVGGTATVVRNNGDTRAGCVDCTTMDVGLSLGQSASIACDVKIGFQGASMAVGCTSCMAVNWKLSGSTTGTSGSCEGSSCDKVSMTAGAAMNSPKVEVKLGWWKVKAAASASFTACEEANSCGACTCGGGSCVEFKPRLSMSVCSGVSALDLCW